MGNLDAFNEAMATEEINAVLEGCCEAVTYHFCSKSEELKKVLVLFI